MVDDPVEEPAVEGLGHSVSRGHGLLVAVVPQDTLAACHHRVGGENLSQVIRGHAKKVGR